MHIENKSLNIAFFYGIYVGLSISIDILVLNKYSRQEILISCLLASSLFVFSLRKFKQFHNKHNK